MGIQKYNIIYADPPWRYTVWSGDKGGTTAESYYPTMAVSEICALPVPSIADENCALFLWATCPLLPRAFEVIKAWGFSYTTVAFVWVKLNRKAKTPFFGLGSWTRANAELCLLATKGDIRRQARNVSQIILSPIERHSRKPDEARNRISALMGDLPRIELFAREKPDGWDVWGNEVESSVAL